MWSKTERRRGTVSLTGRRLTVWSSMESLVSIVFNLSMESLVSIVFNLSMESLVNPQRACARGLQ